MTQNFYIKNIQCNQSIFINDKKKHFITDIIDNISKYNKNTYNLNLSNLKKINENNLYIFKNKHTTFYLKFSSKLSDSALFFNILYKKKNKLYILKLINYHILEKKYIKLKSYEIKDNKINKYKFIKNKNYLFYFSYKNKQLCKIKHSNSKYLINSFIKIPFIRNDLVKNKDFCKLDTDNVNLLYPIDDTNIECNFLKIQKNKKKNKLDKLDKCVLTDKHILLKKIPNIKYIIKKLINKKQIKNAGKIEENFKKNQTNILNRIPNPKISDLTSELKSTLDESYNLVLADVVNDFSTYISDNNISSKTHDVMKLNNAYIKVLYDIKEKASEYGLVKKYSICNNKPIKRYCPIKNLLSCQTLCNNSDDCRFVSYNYKNNICKLFDNCNIKTNYKYSTFLKKSLLRNQGYNWYNRFLLQRNPAIPSRPFYIDIILFCAGVIFVRSLTSIIGRFIVIFLKFFYCVFGNETCYYPTEILYLNESKYKYI